jgi:peptidoglycan hydrolase-like protein with peptidoglycan-binding domain
MLHRTYLTGTWTRRLAAFLSFFFLLLSIGWPIFALAAKVGTVSSDVILRTKASSASVPLATIGADKEITLLEQEGDWYKVKTGSLIGYVMTKYIVEGEASAQAGDDEQAAAEGQNPSAGLKVGDSGAEVTELQQALGQLGFFSGEATGTFGQATEAAVKAYQQARGLAVDGVAGSGTMGKISQETQDISGPTSPGTTSAVLRKGDEGDAVKQMQQALKAQGYFTGEVTGYFGAITESALMAYQTAAGLAPDGVAGATTLNWLLSGSGSGDGAASSGGSTVLRLGDTGTTVSSLQSMLKSAGFYTGGVDGNFGEGTQTALIAFQAAAGLSADGVAGTQTLEKLAGVANGSITLPPSSSAGSGSSSPSGSSGSTSGGSSSGTSGGSSGAVTPSQTNGSIKLVDWWSGEINSIYPRKAIAQLTDVRTGITLNIHRYGGTNHLDFEPATAADADLFRSINGGVGSWSARPAILTVNGTRYACAINTMGHGGQHLNDNNFEGQLCAHFLNSYTHGGGQVNADMQTQIMVAFNSGK